MTAKPIFRTIEVARIDADPDQPRKEFKQEDIAELAKSLKSNGQLQAIAVRYDKSSKRYRIVAGERRWRAAQHGGIETLNAQVFDIDDDRAFELQIAENVNREDMSPMEEAAAYDVLHRRGWEISRIAGAYGKTEPYVQWRIDLLNLNPDAKELVEKGHLPINAAWYVCKLPADTQQRFLVKWARGDFRSPRDAEEFAKACRAVEAQGSFFTLDESEHTEERREEVAAARRRVISKVERLATAGEILTELAGTDPAELAQVLAGAEGGIAAYQERISHLQAAAGKAVTVLRKAAAIAAAVTIDIDPAALAADGNGDQSEEQPETPQDDDADIHADAATDEDDKGEEFDDNQEDGEQRVTPAVADLALASA
ncbi:ParB/RepB/Spo0J family partition protein [Actinoplanes sp. NPDC051859]|uniref:ParB/RepB/Spo0J family partition protein n=1 Tax=Actinoplanes sp. NPDC051859 TaxID=3363909 RepID=UPI0037B407CF